MKLYNMMVSDIVYRRNMSFEHGCITFDVLKIEYDDDVQMMFDVHVQWSALDSIELYVTF